MPHFFISYAKKDTRDLALALNDALNAIDGVTAWVDQSIEIGAYWELTIQKEIRRCDYMVVLYSDDINRHLENPELDPSYVLKEISYARTIKKHIIPVMAQATEAPFSLHDVQHIEFAGGQMSFDALVSRIFGAARLKIASEPPTQQSNNSLQAALERARNFKGKRNSDWTPFIHTFEVHGIPFEMCLVPSGNFQMGSNRRKDEQPMHTQIITKPFWIARYPVTNAQWRAATSTSNEIIDPPIRLEYYDDPARIDHPVVGITWDQCAHFITWLGASWDLLTETEWEYAARGPEGLEYPWGNHWKANSVIYNRSWEDGTDKVGRRSEGASWVGAEDMCGNVWEWLGSLYRPYPYRDDDGREDLLSTGERCIRGSSWRSNEFFLYAAHRRGNAPSLTGLHTGLRVTMSIPS